MKTYELLKDIGTYKAGEKFETDIHDYIFLNFNYSLNPFIIHLLVESGVLKDCDEKWVPKYKETYYYSTITNESLHGKSEWTDDNFDNHLLKHNLVFKTKEEAIARSKELLAIKE